VFCVDLRTNSIISLYSINLSVFITEAESVYCALRTGSLNQTATFSSLEGEAINFDTICITYSTVTDTEEISQMGGAGVAQSP